MTADNLTTMMTAYQGMPLRDVVFYTLRKAILRGDLQPGERLMEIRLANRLGVSRTPVREAIRMLELEGLVINLPRRGAQVSRITEKDLHDVLEVREGLEEIAVSLSCERISEQELRDLYQASRDFEALVETDDVTALAEADERFHAIIYRSTRNDRLVQLINNLREQMYRYRVEYLKDAANRATLVREHDELWKRISERSKEEAKVCMKTHIERQMASIRKGLE